MISEVQAQYDRMAADLDAARQRQRHWALVTEDPHYQDWKRMWIDETDDLVQRLVVIDKKDLEREQAVIKARRAIVEQFEKMASITAVQELERQLKKYYDQNQLFIQDATANEVTKATRRKKSTDPPQASASA